jgi:hypothetical protein
MHRWVGFGVIADNLMNIATFAKARAAAWRNRRNETTGHQIGRAIETGQLVERSFLHREVD